MTLTGTSDKEATRSDGSPVADWLTRRGRTATYGLVGGYSGAPGGTYYAPVYAGPGTPDYFLRLNFDPDGQLTAWEKFVR